MDSPRLSSAIAARQQKESTASSVIVTRPHKDSTASSGIFRRRHKDSTTSSMMFNKDGAILTEQLSSGSLYNSSTKGLTRRRRETIRKISRVKKQAQTEKSIQKLTENSRSDSKRRSEGDKLMKFLWKDVRCRATDNLDMTLNHDAVELWNLDEKGTLLKYAVSHNFTDVVAVLLRHNSPIESHGEDGLSPLHSAIKLGYLPILALLLVNNRNINVPTLYEKRTPLHVAVRCNSSEALELLLNHGADVNKGDIYGSTPLHLASRLGREHLLKILIDNGANVQVIDNEGWTPLHAAGEAGHAATVRILLDSHSIVDAQSKYGKTCLHWACGNGHLPVVEALLDHNANTTIRDANDKIASDYTIMPLLRNLIASYTKEPEIPKISEQKTDYFDVRLPKKSLIDLLDLSQYSDPYAHHLNVEMIGRWAMKDALSKAKKDKSRSMPYIMYDSDSQLDSIQSSVDELSRPRAMTIDQGIPSPYTLDGGPIGRVYATNDWLKPPETSRSMASSLSSLSTVYGAERIDSNPICESLPLLSLGVILEERPISGVQFTIAEEPILAASPSAIEIGSGTESSAETGNDVKDTADGKQSPSGDATTEKEENNSSECTDSSIEEPQIKIQKVSNSFKCKVPTIKLIETLETLHEQVDESVEENVDILNDVFRDVIMLRHQSGNVDTKTRQTALENIEDNLKTVVMKLNDLRGIFSSISSEA